MKVSAKTSRRLGQLKALLPLKENAEFHKHVLNGGDAEMWLLKYEKTLQGKRLRKQGM
jgi:hypothetical protein